MFAAAPFFGLLLSAVVLRDAGFVDIERADFTLSGGRSLMTARKQG